MEGYIPSLMAVTPLFTDMTGNIPFVKPLVPGLLASGVPRSNTGQSEAQVCESKEASVLRRRP